MKGPLILLALALSAFVASPATASAESRDPGYCKYSCEPRLDPPICEDAPPLRVDPYIAFDREAPVTECWDPCEATVDVKAYEPEYLGPPIHACNTDPVCGVGVEWFAEPMCFEPVCYEMKDESGVVVPICTPVLPIDW